ncbi:MFS transporter [Actinomadura scrupuli]|uniref:MFS transporter n=1 Tax=Actinomadura scrupuli TaxID=559629 RepID=UPI003D984C67
MALEVPAKTPPGGLLSGRYRAPTLGIVLLVTLLAFDEMAVGTALPVTARELGGLPLYAWAFSATLIASLLANVVAGGWADVSGPARPLLAGLACFVAGLVLAGLAPGMGWFVAGRAIQGLGAGAAIVAMYVVVARVYPEELRPRVFAGLAAAWVVPSLVGPTVAGLVAEHLHWRWVFLGLIPLVVPAAAMLLPVLRRTGGGSGAFSGARSLAAAAVAAGAALLLYGLDHAVIVLTVLGLLGLVAGLPRLLPSGTLRLRRGLPAAVAMRGLFAIGFFGTEAFIPLGLTALHGFTPTQAGIVLTVGALGWSAASWVQGRSTRSRPFFVVLGAFLLAIGVTAIVLATPVHGWLAAPAWVVAGAGMGFGTAALSVLIMNRSAPAEQGTNSAAMQISDTVGASLAVGVAGALVTGSAHHAWLSGGGLADGIRTAGILTALIAVAAVIAAFRVEAPHD